MALEMIGTLRSAASLLLASALIIAGCYSAVLLLFFAHPSSGWLLMAAGLPIGGLIETSRPGDHRTAHSATAGSIAQRFFRRGRRRSATAAVPDRTKCWPVRCGVGQSARLALR